MGTATLSKNTKNLLEVLLKDVTASASGQAEMAEAPAEKGASPTSLLLLRFPLPPPPAQ